jgi:hypothetical protein
MHPLWALDQRQKLAIAAEFWRAVAWVLLAYSRR